MPSEYEALVAALKLTSTPVAEYGWKTRPEGAYYVVQLEGESGQLNGDGEKQDRAWEGSLDLFYPKLTDRNDLIDATEEILTEIFGASWELSSRNPRSAPVNGTSSWERESASLLPPSAHPRQRAPWA